MVFQIRNGMLWTIVWSSEKARAEKAGTDSAPHKSIKVEVEQRRLNLVGNNKIVTIEECQVEGIDSVAVQGEPIGSDTRHRNHLKFYDSVVDGEVDEEVDVEVEGKCVDCS